MRTDREIADATLEVAREFSDQAAIECDANERDREAVASGMAILADRWNEVADEYAKIGRVSSDAGQQRSDLLEEAREEARKIKDQADAAAKKQREDAEEEARQITAAAAEATATRVQQVEEAEAKASKATEDAKHERKRAADLMLEAETKSAAADAQTMEAQQHIEQVGRHAVETSQARIDAQANQKRTADILEVAELTLQQLQLVDRASREDQLALTIEDSPRGVSMNEAAMNDEERTAYRAPWSDIARSIARAVAEAVVRVRDVVRSAFERVEMMHNVAMSRIVADRRTVADERSAWDKDRTQLEKNQAEVAKQADAAREFADAWKLVAPDQLTPTVASAITAARGLLSQVDEPPATIVRSKGRVEEVAEEFPLTRVKPGSER